MSLESEEMKSDVGTYTEEEECDGLVRDIVISNTDPTLRNNPTGHYEPSIAINPANPHELVITASSGWWVPASSYNAALFHSLDGGRTWSKRFSIPIPTNVPSATGCPCDETVDFGRNGLLYGSFLSESPQNVYTGSTDDPDQASHWQWNGNPAQPTDQVDLGSADQPWVIVNRDPVNPAQDNVYVGYVDLAPNPLSMRVAVSKGAVPPQFTTALDQQVGTAQGGFADPGLRIAADHETGYMYAVYQQPSQVSGQVFPFFTITYRLNCSRDGGQTWSLNGDPQGIIIDTVTSEQGKFGTVNQLIGGIVHVAVDPLTGNVYVVYGGDSLGAGGNRILIRRVDGLRSGTPTIGSASFVSFGVSAALPSVAVTSDGVVGVLYDTFDGWTHDNFPIFSAHLARSYDQGTTFHDTTLLTFASTVQDDTSDPRQRILGDYHQMKAYGRHFYGVFIGNGRHFGRSFGVMDPIFFAFPSKDKV